MVREEDVPPELRSVPGARKNPREEHYFARALPEHDFLLSETYSAYYKWTEAFPRYQTMAHNEIEGKYKPLLRTFKDIIPHYHELPGASPPDPSPDLTQVIKEKALAAGADIVGITRFDKKYVFAEHKEEARFKHIIVLGRAFDWETTNGIPSVSWDIESYDALIALAFVGVGLAEYIRSKGYPVQFVSGSLAFGVYRLLAPVIPYAIQAGLGQLGANGQLLTPQFGSRLRLMMISTSAPVTHDVPVDYGINVLCDKCQVCVRRCPGRAIPGAKEKINWRGVLKNKIITDRCLPMFQFAECNICTKVCPVQHYGLKAVLDHYGSSGQILGKGTDELEGYTIPGRGYFPVGELPKFTTEEGGRGLAKMLTSLGVTKAEKPRYPGEESTE